MLFLWQTRIQLDMHREVQYVQSEVNKQTKKQQKKKRNFQVSAASGRSGDLDVKSLCANVRRATIIITSKRRDQWCESRSEVRGSEGGGGGRGRENVYLTAAKWKVFLTSNTDTKTFPFQTLPICLYI